MSYSPHTWVDNETITASKLNNLEDGVQEAAQSGGGAATIKLSAEGVNSTSKLFGFLVYASYTNGAWVVSSDDDALWRGLNGHNTPDDLFVVMPLPSGDDCGLFLIDYFRDERTITGNISQTGETLYYSYGSVVEATESAFRITGDGSYTFIGT